MRVFTSLALFVLAITASSFIKRDDNSLSDGMMMASINGKPFTLRQDQLVNGMLLTKSGSMDGRIPTRTVITTTFYGSSYTFNNTTFDENISLELQYDCDKKCTGNLFAFSLQYDSTNYYMVREQSQLTISHFACEADKRHFRLSGEFTCSMRSWGYPTYNKPDITLKGRLINLRITIPGWFASRI